jgi:virginiamycin B lyase
MAALALAAFGGDAASAAVGTITEYPIPDGASRPLASLRAITAGPDGRMWFTENAGNANKIGRVTTAGVMDEITLPTAFAGPIGITVGHDGNMWFTEGGSSAAVGHLPPSATSGADVTEINVPSAGSSPFDIAAGPDGKLWFTEFGSTNGGKIGVVDPATANITEFVVGFNYSPATPHANPYGIVSGPGGKLWFSTNGSAMIGFITPPGADVPVTDQYALPGSGNDITVGPDGNLWVAEPGGSIARVTPTGTVTEFPTRHPDEQPVGIAAGPDGYIWFTSLGSPNDHIGRMTTDGVMTAADDFTVPTSGANTMYIAPGPDNRMWFTEESGNKVGAIETGVAPPPGSTPPGSGPPSTPPGETPPSTAPGAEVGCAPNKLILTDVYPKGTRTRLIGVAPAGSAGKRVTFVSNWNHRTVARATVKADLSFTASAPLPPKRLRFSHRARYLVKLGKTHTSALKFARRMYTTAVTSSGRTVTFSGTVTKPLDRPPQPVTIRASASCSSIGSGTIVATVKPSANGAFRATFTLPPGQSTVFLRAQTRVRKHAGSKHTFPTLTLVRGVRLAV